MKLGILGAGMIVKEALEVLSRIEGVSLEAILSTPRSLEKTRALAQSYQIGLVTSDYQILLEQATVDAVYVALPNHLHFQYAKAAILAGKHVICEKPFTMTKSELEELVDLARVHQVFLLEAITNQHLPNFQVMAENLPSLGDIKLVIFNYSQYSSRYDDFKCGIIQPAFDPNKGGGALRDINIYNIHLAVGLFGAPQTVTYAANMDRGVDTSGVLHLDYGDFQVVCIGAKDCNAQLLSTIQGTEGTLSIEGPTNALPVIRLNKLREEERTIAVSGKEHRMQAEFEAFARIIAERDRQTATKLLEHSLAVMAVVDQASPYLIAEVSL